MVAISVVVPISVPAAVLSRMGELVAARCADRGWQFGGLTVADRPRLLVTTPAPDRPDVQWPAEKVASEALIRAIADQPLDPGADRLARIEHARLRRAAAFNDLCEEVARRRRAGSEIEGLDAMRAAEPEWTAYATAVAELAAA